MAVLAVLTRNVETEAGAGTVEELISELSLALGQQIELRSPADPGRASESPGQGAVLVGDRIVGEIV